MKNTGFNTSGAPNKIGSFTPKNVGTTDALPMALFLFDLVNHININGTTNVVLVTLFLCIKNTTLIRTWLEYSVASYKSDNYFNYHKLVSLL